MPFTLHVQKLHKQLDVSWTIHKKKNGQKSVQGLIVFHSGWRLSSVTEEAGHTTFINLQGYIFYKDIKPQ